MTMTTPATSLAAAYRTIVIDPPWPERGGGGRGANVHYALLDTPEIADVILAAPEWSPAANCHLYLWATNTSEPGALAVYHLRPMGPAQWIRAQRPARANHSLLEPSEDSAPVDGQSPDMPSRTASHDSASTPSRA